MSLQLRVEFVPVALATCQLLSLRLRVESAPVAPDTRPLRLRVELAPTAPVTCRVSSCRSGYVSS